METGAILPHELAADATAVTCLPAEVAACAQLGPRVVGVAGRSAGRASLVAQGASVTVKSVEVSGGEVETRVQLD